MKIKFLENARAYSFVLAIIDGFILVFSGLDTYETYRNGVVNEASKLVFTGAVVLFVVLMIAYGCSCVCLKKLERENYVGIGEAVKDVIVALVPSARDGKIAVKAEKLEKEAKETLLWRTLGTGINKQSGIKFAGLMILGLFLLYNAFDVCINRNLQFFNALFATRLLADTKEYWSSAFLLFILGGIVLFNAWMAYQGVKTDGKQILEYAVSRKVSIKELNMEFETSQKCGNCIWVGDKYIFVKNNGIGRVISVKEIKLCQIQRVSGTYPSRLFIPYYVLRLETEEETVYITGMTKQPFQSVKAILEKREDSSDAYIMRQRSL